MGFETRDRSFGPTGFKAAVFGREIDYKDIVERQSELVCRTNSKKNLTFVNDSFCRYFHKRRKDLIGQNFLVFIHEDDRKKAEKFISSLSRTNPVITTEQRVALPNGDIRWQQWVNQALFDSGSVPITYQCVGRDITDRIRAQEAMREYEFNFNTLAENVNDGIIIATAGGALVFANQTAVDITGYRLDMLRKLKLTDLFQIDELDKISQKSFNKMKRKNASLRYATTFVKRHGKALNVEISSSKTIWRGQPAELLIIRDLSHRYRMEKDCSSDGHNLDRRIKKRSLELNKTTGKPEQNQEELLLYKKELEKANNELAQTNTALSVLARNINKKNEAVEKKIALKISSLIIPLIEEIQNDKIPEKSRAKLEVLTAYFDSLIPDATKDHTVIATLSRTELKIAVMIKNGFSSANIARLLHMSPHTVKTHRKNIREKLGIRKAEVNLTSYLKSKLSPTTS